MSLEFKLKNVLLASLISVMACDAGKKNTHSSIDYPDWGCYPKNYGGEFLCEEWEECIDSVCVEKVVKDYDEDGFKSLIHGGEDCDDTNPGINPSITDLCNGIDDNCNNVIDEWGCGKYLYSDSGEEGIISLNLQTGIKKTMYQSSGPINFSLSPDKSKISYILSETKLSIMSVNEEDTKEIMLPGEVLDTKWLSNDTLVSTVEVGYPYFYKLYRIDLNGSIQKIFPEKEHDEILLDAHDGKVIVYHLYEDLDYFSIYNLNNGEKSSIPYSLTGNFSHPDFSRPTLSHNDENLLFFSSKKETDKLLSYNLQTGKVEEIYNLNFNQENPEHFLNGLFIHPSGKERLYFHQESNSVLNKPKLICSIFIDGTGLVCQSYNKDNSVVPYNPSIIEHFP